MKKQNKIQESHGKYKKYFIPSIIFLGIIIVFLDQITKRILLEQIDGLKFITKTCNTGAAFSIFNNSTIFLTIISSIILVILLFIFYHEKDKKIRFLLSIIMAGAVGNLIDRIVDRCVIDFIDVGFWPIFNIADSAISIGVVLLILYMIKEEFFKKKNDNGN